MRPKRKKSDTTEINCELKCNFSEIIGLTKLYLAEFYLTLRPWDLLWIFTSSLSHPLCYQLGKQSNCSGHADPSWSELYLVIGIPGHMFPSTTPTPPPKSPAGQPEALCFRNANSTSPNTSPGFSSLCLHIRCVLWNAFKTHVCAHTEAQWGRIECRR